MWCHRCGVVVGPQIDQIKAALALISGRRRLIVRALGERRGPPAEAKLLYDEPTPPVAIETPAAGWVSLFEDDAVFET